jgi:superoxide dismutase, Fe-Mn family
VVRHHAGGTANHMMWRQRARHLGRTRFRLLCQNVGGPQQDGGAAFGSGWELLAADPQGKLTLVSRRNQDSPLMNGKRFSPATTPERTPIISL